MKIVLFDFCETLVKFQTADAFVHFIRKQTKKRRMNFVYNIHRFLIKIRLISVLEFFFPKSSINKRLVLYQLKGIPKSKLEEFAKQFYLKKIKAQLIKPILEELIKRQNEGFKVFIVSGGYDIYLKYFVNEFNLDGLISTRILFNSNKICVGKIDGIDCLWGNKILLLEKYFGLINIDKKNSFVYTDSKTDIPMLNWVGNGIVVTKKKEKWMYKYKILLWEK